MSMTYKEWEVFICHFMEAVINGNHEEVEKMIFKDDEDAIFSNCLLFDCESPLKIAMSNKDIKMVEILLDYGADINSDNYNRDHALYQATEINSKDLVESILLHDPDETFQHDNSRTALFNAVYHNNIEIVKLLANPDVIDIGSSWRDYPLNMALNKNFIDVAKILIQCSSTYTFSIKNCDGETSLHIASRKGLDEFVKFMLEDNTDIDIKNIHGNTALHLGTLNNHITTVKLLLEADANYELLNNNNETPKIIAEIYGYQNLIDLFTLYEAPITKRAKH